MISPYKRGHISSQTCVHFMKGWGIPDSPVEMKPLLVEVPASLIIEAGSQKPFRGKVAHNKSSKCGY